LIDEGRLPRPWDRYVHTSNALDRNVRNVAALVSKRVSSERARARLRHLSDRYPSYLAVGLLALLGFVLVWTRLIHISESLWHDEAMAVLNHNGLTAALGGHVLYSQLSWATTSLLGESEAMHRFWSVVPGIAAVGFGTWWVWRRVSAVAAVGFAALAVAAPLHLYYVPQARGYGLALLAATLMLIAADRLTRAYSTRMLLGFLGAGLIGIWTLIIFAFSFVGQILSLLRWPRLRRPAIAVLAVAAIVSLLLQGRYSASWIGGEPISLSDALLLDRTLDWIVVPIATLLSPGAADPVTSTWGSVAALALIVLAIIALWRRRDGGLALILVLPVLFYNVAFSIAGFNTSPRHQLHLLPHVLVLVAIAIAEIGYMIARVRILKPVAITGGVIAVLALSNATFNEQQARSVPFENFKEVANVARGAGLNPVVTDSVRPEGLRYYLGDDLIELPSEQMDSMLCGHQPLIYIRHRYRNESPPAGFDCLMSRDSVRVSVIQSGARTQALSPHVERDRGQSIDVWVVHPPRQSSEGGGRG
jgi:MYXO-CTERM domain-containing protein